jgi:hypothetical protein
MSEMALYVALNQSRHYKRNRTRRARLRVQCQFRTHSGKEVTSSGRAVQVLVQVGFDSIEGLARQGESYQNLFCRKEAIWPLSHSIVCIGSRPRRSVANGLTMTLIVWGFLPVRNRKSWPLSALSEYPRDKP